MDSERELQDWIPSRDLGAIAESADPGSHTRAFEAAQAGVEHAKRSVDQEAEALEWNDLVQALLAPAPRRPSAEWSASDALLQEVVDRLVEKGEVSVAWIQAAREAVSQDLDQEAQWSGEIESLPRVVEAVMRMVTGAEAAIGELEDRPGRLWEATESLVEEKELQHAIALGLLEAHAERSSPEVRQELERALLEQRAENWVERERIRAMQSPSAPQYLSNPITGEAEIEQWAYSIAREAIECSASADPALRARSLEIVQAHGDRALESIEMDMEELDLDELELEA
jgi:hypothetical protein